MDYSPIGNIPSRTLQMDCRDGMACPTTPAGGGRANHGENWGSSNPNSRGSDRRKRGGQLSWKTTGGPSRAPGDANGM
jgi:hypothetical protein